MAKTKLLVIVDMQNDFLTGPLGNDECRKAIGEVCEVVRTGSYDGVVFTKDTHNADYLTTQEGKKLPVEHCIEGSEGWNVCNEILEEVNRKYGKDLELHFVGVCTGICVINNVSVTKAFCPEAEISVIERACACVTPDTHRTAVDAMKTFQINII